jgi:hypothetical protein
MLQMDLQSLQREIYTATFAAARAAEQQSAQLKRLMDQGKVDSTKTHEMLEQVSHYIKCVNDNDNNVWPSLGQASKSMACIDVGNAGPCNLPCRSSSVPSVPYSSMSHHSPPALSLLDVLSFTQLPSLMSHDKLSRALN